MCSPAKKAQWYQIFTGVPAKDITALIAQLPWSHHNFLFPVLGLSQVSWYSCRCRYVMHRYDIVVSTILYVNTICLCMQLLSCPLTWSWGKCGIMKVFLTLNWWRNTMDMILYTGKFFSQVTNICKAVMVWVCAWYKYKTLIFPGFYTCTSPVAFEIDSKPTH